jgi:Ran GTPase-activating protein (RanGAP) involved in mRNA processing and transport
MIVLDLSGQVNSSSFSDMIEEIRATPEAEEIYLSANMIRVSQMEALSLALSSNKKLRVLDLTNNEIH